MTEGWALEIFIFLLGLLVLVGVIAKCLRAHDEERQHRDWSDPVTGAGGSLKRLRPPSANDIAKPRSPRK